MKGIISLALPRVKYPFHKGRQARSDRLRVRAGSSDTI
jgi:hypothetical protein